MNNLKKIGLTALASSLVAVSVNAGEMGVSGSFTTTYVTHDGNTVTDANNGGIGIGNNAALSFTGSGELDMVGLLLVTRHLLIQILYQVMLYH
jgi:outer membrane protein OmpU